MIIDPQFSPHRLLLCSLCEEFCKSDLSIEKCVLASVKKTVIVETVLCWFMQYRCFKAVGIKFSYNYNFNFNYKAALQKTNSHYSAQFSSDYLIQILFPVTTVSSTTVIVFPKSNLHINFIYISTKFKHYLKSHCCLGKASKTEYGRIRVTLYVSGKICWEM